MRWYGLKNFENIFTDKLFWLATLNTFIYGFGSTILQNILGLAAALFLAAMIAIVTGLVSKK